jgi:hypothetical protein
MLTAIFLRRKRKSKTLAVLLFVSVLLLIGGILILLK